MNSNTLIKMAPKDEQLTITTEISANVRGISELGKKQDYLIKVLSSPARDLIDFNNDAVRASLRYVDEETGNSLFHRVSDTPWLGLVIDKLIAAGVPYAKNKNGIDPIKLALRSRYSCLAALTMMKRFNKNPVDYQDLYVRIAAEMRTVGEWDYSKSVVSVLCYEPIIAAKLSPATVVKHMLYALDSYTWSMIQKCNMFPLSNLNNDWHKFLIENFDSLLKNPTGRFVLACIVNKGYDYMKQKNDLEQIATYVIGNIIKAAVHDDREGMMKLINFGLSRYQFIEVAHSVMFPFEKENLHPSVLKMLKSIRGEVIKPTFQSDRSSLHRLVPVNPKYLAEMQERSEPAQEQSASSSSSGDNQSSSSSSSEANQPSSSSSSGANQPSSSQQKEHEYQENNEDDEATEDEVPASSSTKKKPKNYAINQQKKTRKVILNKAKIYLKPDTTPNRNTLPSIVREMRYAWYALNNIKAVIEKGGKPSKNQITKALEYDEKLEEHRNVLDITDPGAFNEVDYENAKENLINYNKLLYNESKNGKEQFKKFEKLKNEEEAYERAYVPFRKQIFAKYIAGWSEKFTHRDLYIAKAISARISFYKVYTTVKLASDALIERWATARVRADELETILDASLAYRLQADDDFADQLRELLPGAPDEDDPRLARLTSDLVLFETTQKELNEKGQLKDDLDKIKLAKISLIIYLDPNTNLVDGTKIPDDLQPMMKARNALAMYEKMIREGNRLSDNQIKKALEYDKQLKNTQEDIDIPKPGQSSEYEYEAAKQEFRNYFQGIYSAAQQGRTALSNFKKDATNYWKRKTAREELRKQVFSKYASGQLRDLIDKKIHRDPDYYLNITYEQMYNSTKPLSVEECIDKRVAAAIEDYAYSASLAYRLPADDDFANELRGLLLLPDAPDEDAPEPVSVLGVSALLGDNEDDQVPGQSSSQIPDLDKVV